MFDPTQSQRKACSQRKNTQHFPTTSNRKHQINAKNLSSQRPNYASSQSAYKSFIKPSFNSMHDSSRNNFQEFASKPHVQTFDMGIDMLSALNEQRGLIPAHKAFTPSLEFYHVPVEERENLDDQFFGPSPFQPFDSDTNNSTKSFDDLHEQVTHKLLEGQFGSKFEYQTQEYPDSSRLGLEPLHFGPVDMSGMFQPYGQVALNQ